jgi:multimeric flavodoxin WrbA
MSKNILLVSASPGKGGNSDLLCDEFMRGAREAGHVAEKIRFAEKEINYCKGCCACVDNPGACLQQDDMNEIFQKGYSPPMSSFWPLRSIFIP